MQLLTSLGWSIVAPSYKLFAGELVNLVREKYHVFLKIINLLVHIDLCAVFEWTVIKVLLLTFVIYSLFIVQYKYELFMILLL